MEEAIPHSVSVDLFAEFSETADLIELKGEEEAEEVGNSEDEQEKDEGLAVSKEGGVLLEVVVRQSRVRSGIRV